MAHDRMDDVAPPRARSASGRPPATRPTPVTPKSRCRPLRAFGSAVVQCLENRRGFVLLPLALIAGIVAVTVAPTELSGWATSMLFVSALGAVYLTRRSFVPFHLAVLATAAVVGFGLPQLHGALFDAPMLQGVAYGTYEVRVDGIHSDEGEDARVILSRLVPGPEADNLDIRRARVLIASSEKPDVGALISVRLRFYEVPGPITPYGYDSQVQRISMASAPSARQSGPSRWWSRARAGCRCA